jgi:hypothetical protein
MSQISVKAEILLYLDSFELLDIWNLSRYRKKGRNTALPGVIRVVRYLKEVGRLLILLALRHSAPHPSVKPAIKIYITNRNNNVNIPTKSREYVMKVKGIQF